MTTTCISAHVVQAAAFIQRHHSHFAIDHPAMEMATDTLRAAGVWSLADVDLPLAAEPPKVAMVVKGTFCAGDRRRIVYRLLADDQEIGTAVCWPAKTLWPWRLTIASANIVNFGFRDKTSLTRAVERFVRTGEIV
jgi:hypothetical protein